MFSLSACVTRTSQCLDIKEGVFFKMLANATAPSYTNLHTRRSCVKDRVFTSVFSRIRIVQSKEFCGSLKLLQLSLWKNTKLEDYVSRNVKIKPSAGLKCSYLGNLVNADGAAAFDWVLVVDQVLLMTSVFLTYMAGVLPSGNSFFKSRKNKVDESWMPESNIVSGSAVIKDEQVDLNFAWIVVKKKLRDSLNSIEHEGNLGDRAFNFDQKLAKRPLSLYAIAEGPRLRLLWDTLHRLQNEVNNISNQSQNINMKDWLEIFANIIQKSCQPLCMGWLENELVDNTRPDQALLSIMYEKLKGDETILQKIRTSGKEDLYSEFLSFLRFGSNWKDRCYDHSLYALHGVAILEDLVITLADGIASIYLELISVDGNMSNEMNTVDSVLCSLSTRELQKLRNEVALYQWMHRNMEAIISMYEDRFDLSTLETQLVEEPNKSQTENFSWWKKIALGNAASVSSTLSYIVISHFSMPVKRTKELRALIGWRYYFSLFLELSDITMPLIRGIVDKVSRAISFFLVCLIGRSLGLIYTGIRQSLRWK